MSFQKKSMQYVRLGSSGLKVSRIILETMSYGFPEWPKWVLGEEEGVKHIKLAYEMGIQTFGTANVYSNGLSEVILGNAIKELNLTRDEVVVMTKVCFNVGHRIDEIVLRGGGYPNEHGLSRKRLQLDYVDVLQCHRFDYNTPIAETMQVLHNVIKAGYARYIGMSSCYAYQGEREMMPALKMFGFGSIPWFPLARGFLTRPLNQQQIKRGQTDCAPVVGTTNLNNLEELADAVNTKLDEEEIKYLKEPYAPQAVFGHS
ncbi:NADP-dependent oxidoreductase domain-containing protein [Rhizoctonia solani]|nr:NADP-dependent oxidoreductase domain-containing protein [Rhizoctonia solani]